MTAEQLIERVRAAGMNIPHDDWVDMLETIIGDLQTDLDAALEEQG